MTETPIYIVDTGISEDVEMLLAGLEVESVAELKRMVDLAKLVERVGLEHGEVAVIYPGERVSSDVSRGAAVRQPHGCEGQLQQ